MNELTTREYLLQVSAKIEKLENDLAGFKQIKANYEAMKAELTAAMEANGVDKFISENGTQFTLVQGQPDTWNEVQAFAETQFKIDHPDLYEKYLFTTTEYKSGRKAYVKITLPKGGK